VSQDAQTVELVRSRYAAAAAAATAPGDSGCCGPATGSLQVGSEVFGAALYGADADDLRVANVKFLQGRIEAVPLADASVDVVISNCVVNLSVDMYLTGLALAGFTRASVEFTHEVAPGTHGAIIRATKPDTAAPA